MSKFSRVYKNLDAAISSNKTWKTGDSIRHTQRAESSTDMAYLRYKQPKKSSTSILKTNKAGEPITIQKGNQVFHKRSDGKWYTD